MRSRLIVAFSLACLLMVSIAGPASAGGILGGRIGYSVAQIAVDATQTLDEENRDGVAVSGFLQMGTGLLSIQPEVSYVEKGANNFELNYLELAALAKLGLPTPGMFSPHAFGGIGADFEVSKTTDFTVETSSVDWNAIFGADVMIHLTKLVLVADGRYALGLKDIHEASDIVTDLKNQAWIFSIGAGITF